MTRDYLSGSRKPDSSNGATAVATAAALVAVNASAGK
jgi:hypothetical protein